VDEIRPPRKSEQPLPAVRNGKQPPDFRRPISTPLSPFFWSTSFIYTSVIFPVSRIYTDYDQNRCARKHSRYTRKYGDGRSINNYSRRIPFDLLRATIFCPVRGATSDEPRNPFLFYLNATTAVRFCPVRGRRTRVTVFGRREIHYVRRRAIYIFVTRFVAVKHTRRFRRRRALPFPLAVRRVGHVLIHFYTRVYYNNVSAVTSLYALRRYHRAPEFPKPEHLG